MTITMTMRTRRVRYSTDEAGAVAPRFVASLRACLDELETALREEDWMTMARQARNCLYDATTLRDIAQDEVAKERAA